MRPAVDTPTLRGHVAFRRLWAGDTISQFGGTLSMLAIPLLAVQHLGAGELEMGLLEACSMLAFLVVGLPAGAWVDRLDHRRVLVVTDLLRFAALGTLALLVWSGGGAMWQLYVVALAVGTCRVFFDVAYQSFLPALVAPAQLVEGNAKLEASRAVAEVSGPALGGQLLRVVSLPALVLVDAVSFLWSALLVARIEVPPAARVAEPRRALRVEVREGLAFVFGHPILARIVACTALCNLASAMTGALFTLYALRDLSLSAAELGAVFGVGASGGLLAALAAAPLARRVGAARLIPLSIALAPPAAALVPLAPSVPLPAAVTLGASWAVLSFAGVLYNITQVSFRQRLCPPRLLGRMNASVRFVVFGVLPLGSLVGGGLGAWLGVTPTLWIATAVGALGLVPVASSRALRRRDLPVTGGAEATGDDRV